MYIDLFAGCGGLSYGLFKSGWCGLFAVEKNSDAFATLKHNLIDKHQHFHWPRWLKMENIDINTLLKEYNNELIKLRGGVNLLVGGPPCQGFSMAGKRESGDIRNSLVNSYVKFVGMVQPEMLFFENVHGFTVGFQEDKDINVKGIPHSTVLINKLEKKGYCVAWRLLNMSEFGVPQNRKRFILFASKNFDANIFFYKLEANRTSFLIEKGLKTPVNIRTAISDLQRKHGEVPSEDSKGFMNGKYGRKNTTYQRLMRVNNKRGALPNSHRFVNHKDETIKLNKLLMEVSKQTVRVTPEMKLVDGLKKRSVTPLKFNSICPTITSIPDDFIHYAEPRIMTVREHARIQSFPDDYEFKGKYTTGGVLRKIDVPRYTQVANAVPPLFAEQVGLVLRDLSNQRLKWILG